jgi:hypothetical protein
MAQGGPFDVAHHRQEDDKEHGLEEYKTVRFWGILVAFNVLTI